MPNSVPEVRGVNLDAQTRCAHFHGSTDIIAIKMKCCGVYYACKDCHAALADHPSEIWPEGEWEEKAILLGSQQDIPFYQRRLLSYQSGKPWRENSS